MAALINFITIHKLMLNMKMESAKLEIKREGHTLPYNKNHWDYEKKSLQKSIDICGFAAGNHHKSMSF